MSYKQVEKGAVDVQVSLRFLDANGNPATVDHATAGLALWYRRDGGLKTTITPAALAALDSAHSDGGVEPISDGDTRVDAPDAAFATGVRSVIVGGSATNLTCIPAYVDLFDQVDVLNNGVKVGQIADDTITAASIAAGAFTAAKFATDALSAAKFAADALAAIGTACWANATRLLTAGTNIVLAKGVGVTGLNDLDAAGIRSAVGLTSANLETLLTALDGYKKNVAVSNFSFPMFLTTGSLASGVAITGEISKDGGNYVAFTNAITEIQTSGTFKLNITQAEMNGDEILLKFAGTGCRPMIIKIRTQS